MTPTQIETAARNRYNATGDSFFSSAEILDLIYQACIEISVPNSLIEGIYTASTVIGQQGYSYPSTAISIKRISYEGVKLKNYTMREDDSVTGLDQSTASTGTPTYYFIWNETIYLRPVPDSVGTLKIYTYNEPQVITATSSLEIPSQFHMGLVYYIVSAMALKDGNINVAREYDMKWQKTVIDAKKWVRISKRADSFTNVQDEDQLVGGYLGLV